MHSSVNMTEMESAFSCSQRKFVRAIRTHHQTAFIWQRIARDSSDRDRKRNRERGDTQRRARSQFLPQNRKRCDARYVNCVDERIDEQLLRRHKRQQIVCACAALDERERHEKL